MAWLLTAARMLNMCVRNSITCQQIVRCSPSITSWVLVQVPQYVLDAAIRDGRGAECSIVCTQPRRISAVGVAGRVAQVQLQ